MERPGSQVNSQPCVPAQSRSQWTPDRSMSPAQTNPKVSDDVLPVRLLESSDRWEKSHKARVQFLYNRRPPSHPASFGRTAPTTVRDNRARPSCPARTQSEIAKLLQSFVRLLIHGHVPFLYRTFSTPHPESSHADVREAL